LNDDAALRIVKLSFPRSRLFTTPKTNVDTWITMLEQLLSCNYDNYTVTVKKDHFKSSTDVEIEFASQDDAVWFRLSQRD
jgi:hypothetical protein